MEDSERLERLREAVQRMRGELGGARGELDVTRAELAVANAELAVTRAEAERVKDDTRRLDTWELVLGEVAGKGVRPMLDIATQALGIAGAEAVQELRQSFEQALEREREQASRVPRGAAVALLSAWLAWWDYGKDREHVVAPAEPTRAILGRSKDGPRLVGKDVGAVH